MVRDAHKYFWIEAVDIVDRLTQGLIQMRDGTPPPSGVRELLRLAHTLKGAAHVVGESSIGEAAHALEGQLQPHSGQPLLSPQLASDLLVAVERIAQMISTQQNRGSVPSQPEPPAREAAPPELPGFVREAAPLARAAAEPHAEEVLRTVRVDLDEMDQVVHGVTESMVRLGAVQSSMAAVDRAVALANALNLHAGARIAAAESAQTQQRIAGLAENLSATMVHLQRELASHVNQLERELSSLQESTSHLRLTSAHGLFIPMERAAIAAARELGKQIRFTSSGGDMRIDAQLLAAVRAPLLHIVRNAVAHGIEAPNDRIAKGKPAVGVVELSVERRGSQVAFLCRDDGRGIDLEAIRRAAIERGFMTKSEAAQASEQQLIALITRPDFTTEAHLSQISGRGIGLDAVAEILSRLHGSIHFSTRAGEGTTIEIMAPAALLVTEVVLAESAGQVVGVPADSIRETLRIQSGDIVHDQGHDKLMVGDSLVPYFAMADALGSGRSAVASIAALLEVNGVRAAIGVDRLLGTGALVSRPLPELVLAEPYVSGVALDPQGKPQLILDPAGLVEAALTRTMAAPVVAPRTLPVLVVDDSLTTRMLEQSILEAAGYDVDTAISAEEALEKAATRDYGIFLVDVEMPGMNGFEFVELTRRDDRLRQVPAILVTSRASAEDRARGRSVGASEYVVKSEFDQGYLLDRIQQLVRSA